MVRLVWMKINKYPKAVKKKKRKLVSISTKFSVFFLFFSATQEVLSSSSPTSEINETPFSQLSPSPFLPSLSFESSDVATNDNIPPAPSPTEFESEAAFYNYLNNYYYPTFFNLESEEWLDMAVINQYLLWITNSRSQIILVSSISTEARICLANLLSYATFFFFQSLLKVQLHTLIICQILHCLHHN